MSRHQPYDKVPRPRRAKKRTTAKSAKAPIELPVVNTTSTALPYPISSAVSQTTSKGTSKPPERVATPPANTTNMSVEGGVKRTKKTERQVEERPVKEPEPWRCDFPGCKSKIKHSSACNIERHQRIHNEVKDYFCTWPECDYSTAQKHTRDSHMFKHTGRKHRCGVEVDGVPCDRKFTGSSQLSRHRQAEHDWPTREEKRLIKMGLDPTVEAVSPATIKALRARARKKERTSSANPSPAPPTTSTSLSSQGCASSSVPSHWPTPPPPSVPPPSVYNRSPEPTGPTIEGALPISTDQPAYPQATASRVARAPSRPAATNAAPISSAVPQQPYTCPPPAPPCEPTTRGTSRGTQLPQSTYTRPPPEPPSASTSVRVYSIVRFLSYALPAPEPPSAHPCVMSPAPRDMYTYPAPTPYPHATTTGARLGLLPACGRSSMYMAVHGQPTYTFPLPAPLVHPTMPEDLPDCPPMYTYPPPPPPPQPYILRPAASRYAVSSSNARYRRSSMSTPSQNSSPGPSSYVAGSRTSLPASQGPSPFPDPGDPLVREHLSSRSAYSSAPCEDYPVNRYSAAPQSVRASSDENRARLVSVITSG